MRDEVQNQKGSEGMRQKTWEELDANDQIERCRREIKRRDRIFDRMAGYLNKLIAHQHLDGKMVQPINHPNAEPSGGFYYPKRPDEFF